MENDTNVSAHPMRPNAVYNGGHPLTWDWVPPPPIIHQATIIDGDCRAPHDIDLQDQNLTPIDFDYTLSMQSAPPKMKENQVLRHCRELDKPEKFFLSQSWKRLIDFYAKDGPVVIITSPRRSKSRTLPDSFLSSYSADSISVISS